MSKPHILHLIRKYNNSSISLFKKNDRKFSFSEFELAQINKAEGKAMFTCQAQTLYQILAFFSLLNKT